MHKTIISAINRVEFVSDRRCVVSDHCSEREHSCRKRKKADDVKDIFYEELECVFDRFPKYHMKILLGDFSAKVGRGRHF
jgi:hypothetical protein